MLGIIHVGLGAIGRATVSSILDRPNFAELRAIVDSDPKLVGKDLPTILGRPNARKIPIVTSIKDAKAIAGDAKVAIVTTASRLQLVRQTLIELADAGFNVVSSCEELAWPALRNPELASDLDKYFKAKKVSILGTGVNPGFAMDTFALLASAACGKVKAIRCIRSLDARQRRQNLQDKVAAGMSLEEFRQGLASRKVGLVGCAESAAVLAMGLGWKLEEVDEWFEPIIAEQPIIAGKIKIPAGRVRGMRMMAVGSIGSRKVIELDLTMAIDVETFDEIQIEGDPNLTVRVTTGFPGDTCTVALLVNAAQAIAKLKPGLRTMLDLAPLRSVGV